MRNLDKTYGALFEIYIVRDNYKFQRLEKNNEKIVVLQSFLGDQYIVATVPKDNLYVEDDDVSKSNYDRLASYTDEIIKSIKVSADKAECTFHTNGKLSLRNMIPNKESWKPLAKALTERCYSFINNQ